MTATPEKRQQAIADAISLVSAGRPCEIRILGVDGRSSRTDSGYFDDAEKAAAAVMPYAGSKTTKGCYITLNEINPALVARSKNKIAKWAKITTSDHDIDRRRLLYVDCDPVRPAGISATDEETAAAQQRVNDIMDWMMGQGCCEPMVAMSGNGYHLLFPIDLPNDDESTALIKGILSALSDRYSDDIVSVDQTVNNAARICRVYGTPARKGDSTDDRPHRVSELVYVPDYITNKIDEVCDVEVLRKIAAMANTAEQKSATQQRSQGNGHASTNGPSAYTSRLIVPKYLAAKGIRFREKAGAAGWTNYILEECPFDGNHKAADAMVSQQVEGAVTFKCFHDSCSGHGWQEFKNIAGEPEQDHYDPPLGTGGGSAAPVPWAFYSFEEIKTHAAPRRETIIDQLARRGEVLQLTGATKARKSWMATQLAVSAAIGRDWLGHRTTSGRVLYLDNELHRDDFEFRLQEIADAMKVKPENVPLDYHTLIGEEVDLKELEWQLMNLEPKTYNLVVLDAKYRFFTSLDENKNSDQTLFHNTMDKIAVRMQSVLTLVHHFSKGDQTGKADTDLGAGGGAQTCAAYGVVALLPHEDDEKIVKKTVLRGWPPMGPQTLEFVFPQWFTSDAAPVCRSNSRAEARAQEAMKTKAVNILEMLRREPTHILSENKLSGTKPDVQSFRAAIRMLESDGQTEWVEDYKPPRSSVVTGGWRLVEVDSGSLKLLPILEVDSAVGP